MTEKYHVYRSCCLQFKKTLAHWNIQSLNQYLFREIGRKSIVNVFSVWKKRWEILSDWHIQKITKSFACLQTHRIHTGFDSDTNTSRRFGETIRDSKTLERNWEGSISDHWSFGQADTFRDEWETFHDLYRCIYLRTTASGKRFQERKYGQTLSLGCQASCLQICHPAYSRRS
jgi:hypothetical protein